MSQNARVLVWSEFRHEKTNPKAGEIYPDGMHSVIAAGLREAGGFEVETATLDEAGHGISAERLASFDTIVWWGHLAHDEVNDAATEQVVKAIWGGLGSVFLHSAHFSKPFKRLMGTGCDLKWRESRDREILWVTRPGHPLVAGIQDHILLEREEMYGEFFDIPEPEQTVMISSFSGGEVCRSLMTWSRGAGKIVYFRPGHETHPTYHNPQIRRVIANACRYAARDRKAHQQFGRHDDEWLGQDQASAL